MTATTLRYELQDRGIRLSPDGESIRVRGPKDELTEELQDEIRDHKPELLRHLRKRRECIRITQRIGDTAPTGLGRWDRTWEIVERPSNRFLDALKTWLDQQTVEARAKLHRAADQLVEAWERAGEEWPGESAPGEEYSGFSVSNSASQ